MLSTLCLAFVALSSLTSAAPALALQQEGRFTIYNIPTPAAGPCDLVEGSDGALWGEDILVNKIFRLAPTTGLIQEFDIPFTTAISNNTQVPEPFGPSSPLQDRTAFSCAIRAGDDGNLYASNGVRNQLVRINPTTKKIDIFAPPVNNPTGDLQPFNDLTPAEGGMYLTQTTGNTFQFFSFANQSFTTYLIPVPASFPLGLRVGSDGLLYIALTIGNSILIFDPKTESMTPVPLPELAQFPAVVRAERNGHIYFSLVTGNGVGRINMQTRAIDIYHTDRAGGLGAEDTIDQQGNVYLSFFDIDAIGVLNTTDVDAGFSFIEYPPSVRGLNLLNSTTITVPPAVDVAVTYGPGNALWFASILKNVVVRYQL